MATEDKKNLYTFNDFKKANIFTRPEINYFITHDFPEDLSKQELILDDEDNEFLEDKNDEDFVELNSNVDVKDNFKYEISKSEYEANIRAAIKAAKVDYLDEEIYIVPGTRTREDKLKLTIEAINNSNIKLILNPAFESEFWYSNPFYFDKENKEIGFAKFTAKTNNLDYLKSYFEVVNYYLAMQKLKIKLPLNMIGILVIDLDNSLTRKNLNYKKAYTASGVASKAFPEALNKLELPLLQEKILKNKWKLNEIILEKVDGGEPKQMPKAPIISILNNVFENIEIHKEKDINTLYLTNDKVLLPDDLFSSDYKTDFLLIKDDILSFDEALDLIEKSKIDDFPDLNSYDETTWNNKWKNPFKKEMKAFRFGDEVASFNSKYFEWKDESRISNALEKYNKFPLNYEHGYGLNHGAKKKDRDYADIFKEYIYEDVKYVWYDFETINMADCVMDGFQPYSQVPFQVSIMRTINGDVLIENNEVSENIVLDPKTFTLQDYADMIDRIYSRDLNEIINLSKPAKHKYITYNKSFEKGVLQSIITAFRITKYFPDDVIGRYELKVKYINNNTLDLMDFFSANAKENITPLIFIKDLKLKSSIKLLEKFISSNSIKDSHGKLISDWITPYKTLTIQNGSMALSEGKFRFLEFTGDKSWERTTTFLKQYCENDVKAMLMVFDFVKEVVYKDNQELKALTYKLRNEA